jgi:hypothetical protein
MDSNKMDSNGPKKCPKIGKKTPGGLGLGSRSPTQGEWTQAW